MSKQANTRLCVGDTVIVLKGVDKGKTGEVMKIIAEPKRNKVKVVVDGVNRKLRHTKPSQQNEVGGIVPKYAPVDISNVAYYLAKAKRGTKLGYKWVPKVSGAASNSGGQDKLTKVRFAKVSGEVIPPKVFTKSSGT